MPINRTAWNALVDDSGGNLDGTPLGKTNIKDVILDPIDALLDTGTWSPLLKFGGATTGIAQTVNSATWAESDSIIIVQCEVTLTSKGSATGIAEVSGLPFAALARVTAPLNYDNFASLSHGPVGVIVGSSIFFSQGAATALSALTEANFTNTSHFYYSATYRK